MGVTVLLRVLLLLSMLLPLPLSAAGQASGRLEISTLTERVAIGRWLDILSTSDENILPGELLSSSGKAGESHLSWRRNGTDNVTIGYSGQTWWLRLRTHNAGPATTRVLELSRATIGSIRLYSRDRQGHWNWREAGAQARNPRGEVEAPGYAFHLWLPQGDSEHLIRLQSPYALRTAILLSTDNATLRAAQNSAGWYGWALGVLAGMMLTLLLVRPAHVGFKLVASFAVIQLAVILYALADRGVLGAWWLALPGVQHGLLQLSIMLLQMVYVWFTLIFLHERKALTSFWNSALLFLLGLQATALMLSIVITRHEAIAMLALMPIISALVVTAASVSAIRQEIAGATLLFWSGVALMLSRLVLAFSLTSVLPIAAEPYQWLLGFHILHSAMLLSALYRTEGIGTIQAGQRNGEARTAQLPTRNGHRTDGSGNRELRLPMRVLVVEDNTWVQQVIVGLLRKQGVDTLTAVTGMEALEILERESLDLVLMDCDLPELDGLSATQVWRQRERELRRRPLPILAVTAHVSEAQRQQALDAGMNEFLAKPVDMRTLRDAMIYWTSPQAMNQA